MQWLSNLANRGKSLEGHPPMTLICLNKGIWTGVILIGDPL